MVQENAISDKLKNTMKNKPFRINHTYFQKLKIKEVTMPPSCEERLPMQVGSFSIM